MDFFAGSGTTAQAVIELNAEENSNRNFLLIQMPENIEPLNIEKKQLSKISDITQYRILKSIENYNNKNSLKFSNSQSLYFKKFTLVDIVISRANLRSSLSSGPAPAMDKIISLS